MKLIDLELNLTEGKIDNDIGRWISEGLNNLSNLTKLNLILVDNYIDNFGFELMLEDFDEIEEVVLDVSLNNMIEVNKYDLDNELDNV